jgi:hypothetical protein
VLGLGHRHAVAGHDDGALGFAQHLGRLGGADGCHFALGLGSRSAPPFLAGAPEPKPPAITLMKLRFIAWHMM